MVSDCVSSSSASSEGSLVVRSLGLRPYDAVWHAMSEFTNLRDDAVADEIWFVEHQPVFTQGQAGKPEHVLDLGDIPLVASDRGGQVTYHGPGQLVVYPLLNLRRLGMGVRELVTAIEQSVVDLLALYGIDGAAKPDAPGVYVQERKFASLGLRVRRGCSFHGVAINVDMDLSPFLRINPCGYAGMEMTHLRELIKPKPCPALADVQADYTKILIRTLGYSSAVVEPPSF